MGSCTRRHYLLAICALQLLTIIERQVMDFLGYMWAPILVNFFHIIFVIFGFFGAYQFRPKYIVTYSVWNFLWIGWNIFLVCFYMNVGFLDRESDVLNLGTGSFSWFLINGYGCKPTYPTNITSEDPFRPIRPEKVDNCALEYHTVEVIHSSIQIILAILGIIGAITIGKIFIEEDDDRFDFMGGDAKSPQHTAVHPMYVSYTSLPTGGTLSKDSTAPRRGFGVDEGTKVSLASLEMRPHIKYTELSTERLMEAENGGQFVGIDDLEEEMRDYYGTENLATVEKSGRTRRAVFEAPQKEYEPPKIYRAYALPPPPPHLVTVAPKSPDFEPYRMPQVTKSPHLKTRRRLERQSAVTSAHHCDQIRDAPPGYFMPAIRSGVGSMKMKKSKHRQSLYTIDFTDTIRPGHRDDMGEFGEDGRGQPLSPKPMTPRRVKRRSVMTRGSSGRQSSSSRRSHSGSRSSVRSSRRRMHHQNPVTKLLEQQTRTFAPHKGNSALTASNLKTLNSDLAMPATELFQQPSQMNQLQKLPPVNPDPIYYNMSHQSTGWNSSGASSGGHFNPTYQHSTPNLTQSSENIDELYNNRPPSVRSGYSNFHGTRPVSSSYSQAPAGENVFSGLGQAIPQLPERRAASRESVRSMAFLNSGPPAYNLNYHTPPDSETTM